MDHVRFAPESRHVQRSTSCLLWANSGHQSVTCPSRGRDGRYNLRVLIDGRSWQGSPDG
jgi:hypothetical protein